MVFLVAHATNLEIAPPRWADAAMHDMRPGFEVRVMSGLLTSGEELGPTERLALLFVHMDGGPLGIRFGENIREEVGVGAGTAVAVAANTAVRIRFTTPVRALRLEFDEGLVRTVRLPLLGREQGHYALHSGIAARPEGLVAAAHLLSNDMSSDAGGFSFRSALALAMIEHLAHDRALVRHQEDAATDFTGSGIERALRLIDENLSAPISLTWLAAEAGVSAFHLSRSFRRVTGLNINGYIRERRLKEARRLLAETRKPLAEIAYDCGFSSQSRMTTVFRQSLDITPLAFRQQCWRAGDNGGSVRPAGLQDGA